MSVESVSDARTRGWLLFSVCCPPMQKQDRDYPFEDLQPSVLLDHP